MPEIVIVGDTDCSLNDFAKDLYPDARFFPDNPDYHTVFVSVGDIGVSAFIGLLQCAEKIVYQTKMDAWSDIETQKLTESILYIMLSTTQQYNIEGFDSDIFHLKCNPLRLEILSKTMDITTIGKIAVQRMCNFGPHNRFGLVAIRTSKRPQLWVAGCSFAKGEGLDDPGQRYGDLVAQGLRMETTNIAWGGSSIDFAADQIIRSDLRAGDKVLWGITGVQRYTWFRDGRLENVSMRYTNSLSGNRRHLLTDMLFDDARLCLAQRSIEQVWASCGKIGVDLILIMHDALSLNEHIAPMKIYLSQLPNFVDINSTISQKFPLNQIDSKFNLDLGLDQQHPGPRTHSAWAEIILEFLATKKTG